MSSSWKFCFECAYHEQKKHKGAESPYHICKHPDAAEMDLVTGQPLEVGCYGARSSNGPCFINAVLFERVK